LIVTVGAVVSYVTVLSVDVDTLFVFPAKSLTPPAGTVGMTVPWPVAVIATV